MNDSLWTFLFEIANFVALAAVLAWLLFKPVRKALADQQAKIRQQEDDAAKKLAEAQHTQQEIEAQRRALETELDAMRDKARETAKNQADQIIAEARERAEKRRAEIKRDALQIEQAQISKLAQVVAATTSKSVERFLQQIDGPELEQSLVKTACRELQTFSNGSLTPVTVESAHALDDEARRNIEASLGAAANSADFRVVPELEGGLRISTAQGLIDVSLEGIAAFAEQTLAAEIESIIRGESQSE